MGRKPEGLRKERIMASRCLIITNYLHGKIKDLVDIAEDDFILCADGGYRLAEAEGIVPSMVIGDFDSREDFKQKDVPESIPVDTWPSHKDYTDTGLCLDWALVHGYRQILVIGGFGGREDHTMANFQNLFLFTKQGADIMMVDEQNIAMALLPGDYAFPRKEGWYLSLFAHTPLVKGLTITGVEYPLDDHTLDNDFPLCVCNRAEEEEMTVSFREGELLLVMSRDLKR